MRRRLAVLLVLLPFAGCFAIGETEMKAMGLEDSGLKEMGFFNIPPDPLCAAGKAETLAPAVIGAGARLDVKIVDISGGVGAGIVLASRSFPTGGRLPVAFSLCYDPQGLEDYAKPALQVWLQDGDLTLYRNKIALLLPKGASRTDLTLVLDPL